MTFEDETERFLNLETKIAYQERLLDQLNEVIIEQARHLDDLERRLGKLEGHLRESVLEKPGHEPPPHY